MAPGQSKHVPQQLITHWKIRWPLCFICSYAPFITQHYKRAKNFSARIRLLWKCRQTTCPNNQIHSESRRPLLFTSNYALFITQRYWRTTVQETSLQWIHAASEKPVESHLCYSWLTPCIVSKRIGKKEDKCSTMMLAMRLLQLAKRHVFAWRDVKQWRNQAPVAFLLSRLCLAEGI